MSVDPNTLVTIIERSGSEVWLSDLDALVAKQALANGVSVAPSDVTAGLGVALRKGWLQSDGLRVSVSRSRRLDSAS